MTQTAVPRRSREGTAISGAVRHPAVVPRVNAGDRARAHSENVSFPCGRDPRVSSRNVADRPGLRLPADHFNDERALQMRSPETSRIRVASARSPSFGPSRGRSRSCADQGGPHGSAKTDAIGAQARRCWFDQGTTIVDVEARDTGPRARSIVAGQRLHGPQTGGPKAEVPLSHPLSSPDLSPLRGRAASFDHGLPVTSAILTRDPETGESPPSRVRQVAHCCARFNEARDAAKSDPRDVVRAEMKAPDFGDRSLINPLWPETWQDPQHRPARRAFRSELPPGRIIQMVATTIFPED